MMTLTMVRRYTLMHRIGLLLEKKMYPVAWLWEEGLVKKLALEWAARTMALAWYVMPSLGYVAM